MRREIPIALISAGHGHHRARAVAAEHIVTDPDRNVLAGERMLHERACENAANTFHFRHALALAAVLRLRHVSHHFVASLGGSDAFDQLMFRSERHEAHTEDGVGAGGEHVDALGVILQLERDQRTLAPADPISLRFLDRL